MEMVSAALPSASFKLLGVMPYAAKPSPVSTSLPRWLQGALVIKAPWAVRCLPLLRWHVYVQLRDPHEAVPPKTMVTFG